MQASLMSVVLYFILMERQVSLFFLRRKHISVPTMGMEPAKEGYYPLS